MVIIAVRQQSGVHADKIALTLRATVNAGDLFV
jgi:hypothetical protein